MPELIAAPRNPTWPPTGANLPGVIPHKVARKEPGKLHSPLESLSDIAGSFGVSFADLVEFNFNLKSGEPRYFEKINWYLKYKLRCSKTTAKGNFMFAGGETVYIPPRSIGFPDQPIVAAKPKPAKDIVWQRVGTPAAPGIPGVSSDTTPWEPSPLPGNSGPAADRASGIAQVVQSAAEGLTSLMVKQTTSNRLDAFAKDPQILQNIKPVGPQTGVVIGIRKLQNTLDPSFPQIVNGAFFVGYGDDPNQVIKRWQLLPRFENGFDPNTQAPVYEFYWGTRDYDH